MLEITLGPYRCSFRPWTPHQGGIFDGLFAYDTETTLIDDDRPYLTPSLAGQSSRSLAGCGRATYCSARNCVFQGAAADGAIYGLWLVWRAGHRLVDFVHD
jgi:hypothetical protein